MKALKIQETAFNAGFDSIAPLLDAAEAGGFDMLVYCVDGGAPRWDSAHYTVNPNVYLCFGDLLEAAHARDMRVVAWLTVGCTAWKLGYNARDKGCPRDWFDFSDEEGRATVAAVVADLVAKHPDVDAVILDYIRAAQEDGEAERVDPANVTTTVQAIRDAIPAALPLYASVFCQGWLDVCQDWPVWLSSGLVDAVFPMVYFWDGTETAVSYERRAVFPYWPDPDLGRIIPVAYGYQKDWDANTVKNPNSLMDETELFFDLYGGYGVFDSNLSAETLARFAEIGDEIMGAAEEHRILVNQAADCVAVATEAVQTASAKLIEAASALQLLADFDTKLQQADAAAEQAATLAREAADAL